MFGYKEKIADVGIKEIESAFSKKGGLLRHEAERVCCQDYYSGMKWTSPCAGRAFQNAPGRQNANRRKWQPLYLPMRNLNDNMQEPVDEAAEVELNIWYAPTQRSNTPDDIKLLSKCSMNGCSF